MSSFALRAVWRAYLRCLRDFFILVEIRHQRSIVFALICPMTACNCTTLTAAADTDDDGDDDDGGGDRVSVNEMLMK